MRSQVFTINYQSPDMYILFKCFSNCKVSLFLISPSGVKAPHLETFENVMKFSQMVVQATHHTSSLLQLPHILPEHLRYFASKKVNMEVN